MTTPNDAPADKPAETPAETPAAPAAEASPAPAKPAPASGAGALTKGGEVMLGSVAPGMVRVFVGLGWEAPEENDGFPIDIDASAFLIGRENRVRSDIDFIFYNNLEGEDGGIRHRGDNIEGTESADVDAEIIDIDLEKLNFDIEKIAFAVTIHNAEERQQTFGLVKNAYMRIVNADTNEEVARFDLSEDASEDNAIIFGELVREIESWKFKALGDGSDGGLYQIARDYGVNVAPP
ncbi:MAG: chemical-damaging agent resistance protein C [Alphaproteobacteria bacterium]|nr:chemical-damaging agent resistance protein C [Alphaproteobacteria bacterium]